MHIVGSKGQIVIDSGIRERLGIRPGWLTVQRLVDDHMEIYFVPPEHDRSLKGALAQSVERHISDEDLHAAREAAWEEAARTKASSAGNE